MTISSSARLVGWRSKRSATYKAVDCKVASGEPSRCGRRSSARRRREPQGLSEGGRGLSQEAFADAVAFHRTRMGKIERGGCNLELRTLERIATRVELDPIDLLR